MFHPGSRSGGNGDGGPGSAPDDATLGGYLATHDRPPAFEASDGLPYTVSPEIEKTGNLLAPYSGYLVFPRWAETGVGITGHVETPVLFEESSRNAAENRLGELTLSEVRDLLEEALRRRDDETEPC